MKRIFMYALLATTISMTACEKDRITGSGSVKTEERTLTGFTKVSTSGSTNVFITKGAAFNITVKAYENLIPYLETEVVNGTLEIHYKENTNVKNVNSEVYVTLPVLTATYISGSANIETDGIFNGSTLEASISGSGNITFDAGTYDELNYSSSGSGNLKAFGVTTKHSDISISGSGNAETMATESLNVRISGSGTVYYKGDPETVDTEISGSGKVIKQ
jgi:Putative auto-transporter adhesin, head GIN domain